MQKNGKKTEVDWTRLNEIFTAAAELTATQQSAFLADACGTDRALLSRANELLDAASKIEDRAFLSDDAFVVGARAIASEMGFADLKGQCIGHYRLVSEIARGGMGVVYLADRDDFQHRVALKLIRNGVDSSQINRRFRIERDVLASLNHPNIARLLDGGTTDDGMPFLAMEYVEGKRIDKYCSEHNLGIDEILTLFRKVCSAVEYAHRNLTVHRDIKPSNILVTDGGEPKLLDFGIAKILESDRTLNDDTATGARLLTPEYASPEQIIGDNISTASDVYSLGVLLYELLTGRRPFNLKDRNALEMIEAVCSTDPPPPSSWRDAEFLANLTGQDGVQTSATGRQFTLSELRGDLDNIILTALRKDPDCRYSSVEQFSEDIRRYLEGLPVIARAATLRYRAGKFVRRHRAPVAFAAIAIIGLIIGTGTATWQAVVARNERMRAEQRFNEVRDLANTLISGWDADLQDEPITPAIRGRLADLSSEYLEALSKESDDPELLKETVKAQIALGQNYAYFLIDREKAKQSLVKAEQLARRLAERDPQDVAVNALLALSLAKYNEFFGVEDPARSESNLLEQIAIREASPGIGAGDPAELRDLALTHESFGGVLRRLGRVEEANQHFLRSDEIHAHRVSLFENGEPSAERLARLASALSYRAGNLTFNLKQGMVGLEYAERSARTANDALAANPANRDAIFTAITSNHELGLIAKEIREFDRAIAGFRDSIGLVRTYHPNTADGYMKRKEYDSLLEIADSQFSSGRKAEAIASLDECFRIRRDYTALDINRTSVKQFSSHAYLFETGGRLLWRMGEIAEAERAFDEAERYLEKAISDKRSAHAAAAQLANMLLILGDLNSGISTCYRMPAESWNTDSRCSAASVSSDRRSLNRSTEYYRRSNEMISPFAASAQATYIDTRIQRAASQRLALVQNRL